MKKEKGKKGKITLIVLGTIFGIIVLFAVVSMILSSLGNSANMKLATSFSPVEYTEDKLEPELDSDGNWCFKTDRELKVLQITDVHLGGGWMSTNKDAMAINCVASMITAEKPDLVVVTGDIAFPVPFKSGTFNNKHPAEIFANLMETLGVYWIPVFGNHDTEAYSYYSRDDIGSFYEQEEFKHCLFKKGPSELSGCGNSVITVRNSDDIITQTLFLLDSHSYTDGDYLGILWKYDNIKDNQINWYKDTLNGFVEHNKEVINTIYKDNDVEKQNALNKYAKGNSLLFFHIPLHEYKDAWNEYYDAGLKDTDNLHYYYGNAGETGKIVLCGMHEDNLFETVQSMNANTGLFVGHDHYNNFSMMYKGVRLTYGYSVDYLAYSGIYKYGSQRGCTAIYVKPDGTFDCEGFNYYQDKYQMQNDMPKEEVIMQSLDEFREGNK